MQKIKWYPVKIMLCLYLWAISAYGQNTVNVNGNVQGLWTSNNTYIVQSTITVQAGDTLTIQPGTLIKVNPNCLINIFGTLIAIGTDTTKITFTSNKPNPAPYDWVGIINQITSPPYYQPPAPQNVILKNCIIEYCTVGVNIQTNKNLTVQNCEVRYTNMGIYFCGGNAFIEGNTVHDFYGFNNFIAIGIWSDVCTPNATISCNNIYNGDGDGMDLHSGAHVINNTISNVTNSFQGGWGMKVDVYEKNEISLNYINHCDVGIRMIPIDSIVPHIHNNVINNCTKYGISVSCYDYNGLPQGTPNYKTNGIISNNVICHSGIGIYQYGAPCYSAPTISNNLLYNNSGGNFSNVALNGIGIKTARNVNGDSCDVYQNIFMNPLFINNQPPLTGSTSPCINAGNATYSKNIGYDTGYVCLPPPIPPAPTIDNSLSITVPNIFSPNNDGINDEWFCTASIPANLQTFQLNIFNRWGIKVFGTNNITTPWIGNTIDGQPCTDGTYYYTISYTTTNNKTNKLKGFIQLVR